ncbi:MAG TPA: 16S rRNA (cytidine(1402)-2'-O)-methyltransferase [Acidimicrobiia bacterium]|nr:16S rRNA (cytidine(1402)-2'-O)-methyltransferase [Acidimicrobiia bacterium]
MTRSIDRSERVSVSFECRGHPNIAATHAKTLELTRDAEISRRATCVIGVSSEHDDRELLALRGRVDVVLECNGTHDQFAATMSPFFLGDDSLVFRRGEGLRGDTIAFDATKTAATLDREVVRALGSSDARLRVTVRAAANERVPGVLFVVALPIGNDGDVGARAIRVLERVDLVLAEDTRKLHAIARRIGIETARATSYHDHNEAQRVEGIIERLRSGARVALVSDAGTPLCSDPGYVVVSRAVEEGIAVCPVPGPSALLAVLTASGLPVDRFVFGGFLPRRSSARQQALRELTALGSAVVVYESASRLAATLADMAAVRPDWRVCIGREVTKTFEEFRRGSATELARELASESPLGECTIVIAPPSGGDGERDRDADVTTSDVDGLLRSLLEQGVPASTVAQALKSMPGIGRNEAYDRVHALAAPEARKGT